MKIGLVSDSHGKNKRLRRALAMLMERRVEAVVHCGDICKGKSVETLGAADVETYLVAGNMDRNVEALARAAERCGVRFCPICVEVPIGDGEHLIATHGDNQRLLDELAAGGQFRYICHGHTHRRRDERFGAVRVICPGSLYRPKAPPCRGGAVLETDSDTLQFIDLEGP